MNEEEKEKFKTILFTYEKGLGITDEELNILHKFFNKLEESLSLLGDKYYLALMPVRMRLDHLNSLIYWRRVG